MVRVPLDPLATRARHSDAVALDLAVEGAAAAMLLEESVEVGEQRYAAKRSRRGVATLAPSVRARRMLKRLRVFSLDTTGKPKIPAAVRAYMAKIGAKGGKHTSGAGGKARWKNVSAEERSRRIREVVRKRWAPSTSSRTPRSPRPAPGRPRAHHPLNAKMRLHMHHSPGSAGISVKTVDLT